ncbi:MAG: hypothetical protein ACI9VO_002159, partial [Colwellia sp.]
SASSLSSTSLNIEVFTERNEVLTWLYANV